MTFSAQMYPLIQHEEIERLLRDSALLHLPSHFNFDFEGARDLIHKRQQTVPKGMSFKLYIKQRQSKLAPISKFFLKEMSPHEREFEELAQNSQYLIELNNDDFRASKLTKHYERLKAWVCTDFTNPDGRVQGASGLCWTLVGPAIRWSKDSRLTQKERLRIVNHFEAAIGEADKFVSTPIVNADNIEYLNTLIYCYICVAALLETMLHPTVLANHLLVFRNATPSAWNRVSLRVRMQYATLLLHIASFHLPLDQPFQSKSGISRNVLFNLYSMLEDASGRTAEPPFTTHQWVFRWVKDKLAAEVFSTRVELTQPGSLAVLSESEQAIAVELSRRFSSYRHSVSIHHLERFLLQFRTTEMIRAALKMLTHAKFYPLWELSDSIEKLLRIAAPEDPTRQIVVAPLGDQAGSTAILKYLAGHSDLSDRLKFADNLDEALDLTKGNESLYFVDDCLLSGTQSLSILGDLMGTRQHKPHHTIYAKPLSKKKKAALQERTLSFCYCVATEFGQARMLDSVSATGIDPAQVSVHTGTVEHSSSKVFEPLSPVGWTSSAERDNLKEFAARVGYDILERRAAQKGWDDNRRKNSALGYSDFQRLLVFPYNVPKTTVTLLWERSGQSEARPWQPLFMGAD